jgi:hypothetical protein
MKASVKPPNTVKTEVRKKINKIMKIDAEI